MYDCKVIIQPSVAQSGIANVSQPVLQPPSIENIAGIGGITRSGRCYTPEELERSRKGKAKEGEEAAEIGTEISFDSSIFKKKISEVPSLSEKWEIHGKLQSPPRNSAPIRLHRRCFLTGRPRANYRDFGLSGHILREMVHACLLPGATRSSW